MLVSSSNSWPTQKAPVPCPASQCQNQATTGVKLRAVKAQALAQRTQLGGKLQLSCRPRRAVTACWGPPCRPWLHVPILKVTPSVSHNSGVKPLSGITLDPRLRFEVDIPLGGAPWKLVAPKELQGSAYNLFFHSFPATGKAAKCLGRDQSPWGRLTIDGQHDIQKSCVSRPLFKWL